MSSTKTESISKALLVLIGLFTATPVLGTFDESAIEAAYGIVATDEMTTALLQHRGVLQLILGAAIIYSAFSRSARVPVAVGVLVAKGCFLALTLFDDTTRTALSSVTVGFDLFSIVVVTVVAAYEIKSKKD